MPSRVSIRDARQADAIPIGTLLAELGYPNGADFVRGKIQTLSGNRADRVLVAATTSEVIGLITLHFIPMFHAEGDCCRVTAIVVREGYRRQGIGRKLLKAAEEIARAEACDRVEITTADRRKKAHEFYRRLGYSEVSRRFLKMIEFA